MYVVSICCHMTIRDLNMLCKCFKQNICTIVVKATTIYHMTMDELIY